MNRPRWCVGDGALIACVVTTVAWAGGLESLQLQLLLPNLLQQSVLLDR